MRRWCLIALLAFWGWAVMPHPVHGAMPSDTQVTEDQDDEDEAVDEDPVWSEQEEATWDKLDRVPYWDLKYDLNPWNRLNDRTPNPEGNVYIP